MRYLLAVSGPRSDSSNGEPWYIDPVKQNNKRKSKISQIKTNTLPKINKPKN